MARNPIQVTLKEAWQGEAACGQCSIRTSVLFGGLEEDEFKKIHDPIHQFALEPGTVLYSAGSEARNLYTVRSGLIKLVQYLPDGSYRIVRLGLPTDLIGLEAVLGQPYGHEAVVLQKAEVCQLPVHLIRQLYQESPGLHEELMCRWHRALSEADSWLTAFSTGTARQRVARLILKLCSLEHGQISQLFSREDMGAMLGITTETASRIIAEFKRKGLLQEQAGQCMACDIGALELLAEGE